MNLHLFLALCCSSLLIANPIGPEDKPICERGFSHSSHPHRSGCSCEVPKRKVPVQVCINGPDSSDRTKESSTQVPSPCGECDFEHGFACLQADNQRKPVCGCSGQTKTVNYCID